MAFQWWDAAEIESTVTRTYVSQRLPPEQTGRLDRAVSFGDGVSEGDGLTDLTYWDWIDSKAKRLFLILVDLGVTSQIFDLIDDSWGDDDLPIIPESLERIRSLSARDEKTWRRFYHRQFAYLLRPLLKGDHIAYTDPEMVPLEVLDRKPVLAASSLVDKVALPNAPGTAFWRRRVPIGDTRPGDVSLPEFYDMVDSVSALESEHIASYWASYIHRGHGYIVFAPASDTSLKMLLATQPVSYKSLGKRERGGIVMNWVMCLADTVAFLHSRNRSHRYIKPSTVLFTSENHILLAHPSRLSPEPLTTHTDKKSFDREWYDYAAPEQWFRPTGANTGPPHRKSSLYASPPNGSTISILRPEYSSKPSAMLSTPNPHLNPQAADIFSLGCITLDLLSLLLKKQQKFAAFRAAKHKTPGRGGAVPDSSFHRNLGQVEAWMSALARDAAAKVGEGEVYRGVTPVLHLVARMLSADPRDRPRADEVQRGLYRILTEECGIAEPHCVHRYSDELDEIAMQGLRIDEDGVEGLPVKPRSAVYQHWSYGGTTMGGPSSSFHSSVVRF